MVRDKHSFEGVTTVLCVRPGVNTYGVKEQVMTGVAFVEIVPELKLKAFLSCEPVDNFLVYVQKLKEWGIQDTDKVLGIIEDHHFQPSIIKRMAQEMQRWKDALQVFGFDSMKITQAQWEGYFPEMQEYKRRVSKLITKVVFAKIFEMDAKHIPVNAMQAALMGAAAQQFLPKSPIRRLADG